MANPADSLRRRVVRGVREHPYISAILASCVALGAILAIQLLPPDWALARRFAAGCVGGAGVGLIVTAGRIIG